MFDFVVDPLPDSYREAVDRRNEALAARRSDLPFEAVIDLTRLWVPGQDIRVGFLGGSDDLCGKVEAAANEWCKHGAIVFDFKLVSGSYRRWSRSDRDFKADIRVSFDDPNPGYWSLVGTDSIDRRIASPNQASMNFDGFDSELPQDYAATVMHEFGHALGFQHEHQHPKGFCESEFHWDDDPGYEQTTDARGVFVADLKGRRPGIYTYLSGPPNRWSKKKVDHNLRQLRPSSAFLLQAFDAQSIMKYYFGAWMFTEGDNSKCFSRRNEVLSAGDKAGLATAYPRIS